MKNTYKFFSNKDCKYYPCHDKCNKDFNCLFCYCPLYSMEEKCGGNFKILPNGIKDCSECTIPHEATSYDYIIKKLLENK